MQGRYDVIADGNASDVATTSPRVGSPRNAEPVDVFALTHNLSVEAIACSPFFPTHDRVRADRAQALHPTIDYTRIVATFHHRTPSILIMRLRSRASLPNATERKTRYASLQQWYDQRREQMATAAPGQALASRRR